MLATETVNRVLTPMAGARAARCAKMRLGHFFRGPLSQPLSSPLSISAAFSLSSLQGGSESQRDSATKPRVARNELPWENARHIGDNPERVVADDNGNKTMPQPRWGCESSVALPRVARCWAELHNPFGIEDAGKEQPACRRLQ